MISSCQEKAYRNAGNLPLVQLLDKSAEKILDVGCGAGDNAALIRHRSPGTRVYGITLSPAEARAAAAHLEKVWICDIEQGLPGELSQFRFDAIIFSHVLEHLRNPAGIVAEVTPLLRDGGCMLIAVPNIVNWRQRFKLLRGEFQYERDGIMDETHLRFFTFFTADRYLLAQTPQIDCVEKRADGSVPLWVFRRYCFPRKLSAALDRVGVRLWPNLCGSQVLIKGIKRGATDVSDTIVAARC
jgi:2-polyprenyl-3-methyl-5-hydroxy-6-metoxy-1,4-benzoquinol methylase